MTQANSSYNREDGTVPISDDGLAELERKAFRRMGPPSTTYTLRVVTLQRLISRIRKAEKLDILHGDDVGYREAAMRRFSEGDPLEL